MKNVHNMVLSLETVFLIPNLRIKASGRLIFYGTRNVYPLKED